jgi:hypothetical protein
MKLRHAFFLLFVLGVILPYAYFVPWFLENGFNVKQFFAELFANRVSATFGTDITISTVVLLTFAVFEIRRLKMPRPWLVLAAVFAGTFGAGVSSGFPLFLYLRQRFLDGQGLEK